MSQSKPIITVLVCVFTFFFLVLSAIFGSSLGIFATDEADIQNIITQFDQELEQEISSISESVPHDDLEISMAEPDWVSILAVYAVRSASDPNAPLDVVTPDEIQTDTLREVFWTMTVVSWSTETYYIEDPNAPEDTLPGESSPDSSVPEESIPEASEPEAIVPEETDPRDPPALPTLPPRDDEFIPIQGATVIVPQASEAESEEESVPLLEQTRLLISVCQLSAYEAGDCFAFSAEQREALTELLRPENHALWSDLLPGES